MYASDQDIKKQDGNAEMEESLREIRKTTHGRQTTPASADALEEYACYLYLKWDLPGVLSLLLAGLLI